MKKIYIYNFDFVLKILGKLKKKTKNGNKKNVVPKDAQSCETYGSYLTTWKPFVPRQKLGWFLFDKKVAQCSETNEKSIFRFLRFWVFEI